MRIKLAKKFTVKSLHSREQILCAHDYAQVQAGKHPERSCVH